MFNISLMKDLTRLVCRSLYFMLRSTENSGLFDLFIGAFFVLFFCAAKPSVVYNCIKYHKIFLYFPYFNLSANSLKFYENTVILMNFKENHFGAH